jgi:hypothetical protein
MAMSWGSSGLLSGSWRAHRRAQGDHILTGPGCLLPTFLQPVRQGFLDALEEVSVDPQRERRVRVAHPLSHGQRAGPSSISWEACECRKS